MYALQPYKYDHDTHLEYNFSIKAKQTDSFQTFIRQIFFNDTCINIRFTYLLKISFSFESAISDGSSSISS